MHRTVLFFASLLIAIYAVHGCNCNYTADASQLKQENISLKVSNDSLKSNLSRVQLSLSALELSIDSICTFYQTKIFIQNKLLDSIWIKSDSAWIGVTNWYTDCIIQNIDSVSARIKRNYKMQSSGNLDKK